MHDRTGNEIGRSGQLAARLMLARYLVASLLSLCADMGLFMMLVTTGLGASWAAFVGYAAGIGVHWLLSTRFVFAVAIPDRHRHVQPVQFLLSALMGLAVTVGLVSLMTVMGILAVFAKGIAVVVSFISVYLVRKHVVFGPR